MYQINTLPSIDKVTVASIDLEMFGQEKERLHQPHGTFASLGISLDNGEDYLISDQSMLQQVMDILQPVPVWVFQNATYDLIQLNALCNIQPKSLPLHYIWDTMLVEKVLYSGYYINFSLKDMARRYLEKRLAKDKYEDIADRTINQKVLFDYTIDDTRDTLAVYWKQKPLLEADQKLVDVYNNLDAPSVWVVVNSAPVKVDVKGWHELSVSHAALAKSLEMELGVNVMSPKQVKEMLNAVGIPVESTGDEILAEYAGTPEVDKIREARMYRTAVSKYGDNWLEKYADGEGRVRAGWNVTGTLTGRMSSNNPNLQNIPSRKMPIFRTFFLPIHGVNIVADISQQEPRFTAVMSGDPNLTEIFSNSEDIHSGVTKLLFSLDELDKKDPKRKVGKEVGLGLVYGLSAEGLLGRLKEVAPEITDLTIEKCQGFLDSYFKKFPAVKKMIDKLVKEGFKNEFVRSIYGRKIHVNIHSNGWERGCVNYPHQSSGADMLKAWSIELLKLTREKDIPFGLTMQIHDEIVLDVPTNMVDIYLELIDKAFYKAVELVVPDSPVPFVYEVGTGESWACKE